MERERERERDSCISQRLLYWYEISHKSCYHLILLQYLSAYDITPAKIFTMSSPFQSEDYYREKIYFKINAYR